MEQRQLVSKSQQKLQKMNSSMLAFRELIQTLRMKNKQYFKPSSAQINPQVQSSTQSRVVASQKIIPNISQKHQMNISNSNYSMPQTKIVNDDQGIKLKVRGNVAGRDILNKKPAVVPASKFNETVINNKQHAKNKNIVLNSSAVYQNEQQQHPTLQQIKLLMSKHSSNKQTNSDIKMSPGPSQFPSLSDFNMGQMLTKTATTLPLNKPRFQQNRLNYRAAAASRNKIRDIDQKIIIKYCKQANYLTPSSQAVDIFQFFQSLIQTANVVISTPFIKKFKNCIYFGMPISQDDSYEGFLYFYQGKIYYGQFYKNQKNGKGVQIYFQDQAIFKGIFKEGQKTGKFLVNKNSQKYIGYLQKGLYHGQGKLQTKESIYQGQFENGNKHGFGQQFYPKTGIKMTGYFDNGTFSKRSKSSLSHSEIQKGIKFKSQNRMIKLGNQNKTAFIRNQVIPEQQQKRASKQHYINFDNQINAYNSPYVTNSNSFNSKKSFFNKEKVQSIIPNIKNQRRFVEPMPQNCKDYDYSFDASSKKQSQNFNQFGLFNRMKVYGQPQRGTISQVQEQNNHHLNTSALQQPLPMPNFYKN